MTDRTDITPPDTSRRRVLCGLAVALLAPGALAAACGGSGASTGTGSGSGSGSGSGGAATTAKPAGTVLAKVSDVPVGGGILVDGPSDKMLLVQPTAGDLRGFSAVCPHQGFIVDPPAGGLITCTKGHGSQFSATDGSVRRQPAPSGLVVIDIKVDGQNVVLA